LVLIAFPWVRAHLDASEKSLTIGRRKTGM
jgi:hypothetical protein